MFINYKNVARINKIFIFANKNITYETRDNKIY